MKKYFIKKACISKNHLLVLIAENHMYRCKTTIRFSKKDPSVESS